MEGQTSGESTDPEVGISSIREALSDQHAGLDTLLDVSVLLCVCVMREAYIIRADCCHYLLQMCRLLQLVRTQSQDDVFCVHFRSFAVDDNLASELLSHLKSHQK